MELLVMLSQGLPHYTHLLGYESTVSTINRGKKQITMAEAKKGVHGAIDKTQHF